MTSTTESRRATSRPLEIPAGFWVRPTLRPLLLTLDWAAILGRLLDETGASQETLGHRIGMAQSEVSRVLLGRRTIESLKVLADVVDGLEIPDEAVELIWLGALGRRLGRKESDVERREAIQAAFAAALSAGAVAGPLARMAAAQPRAVNR